MATVEELPTATVVGQYIFVSHDNEDEGTSPQAVLVKGYVRFTCSATPPLIYRSKKLSAVPLVHDAVFDSQGYLIPLITGQIAPTTVPGSVEPGIELLADSPLVNPRGFSWNVSFHLTEAATGRAIPVQSFDLPVLEAGETYDLADYTPVGKSEGSYVIRGESAYEVAQGEGFEGTIEEWIESLKVKGDKGDQGDIGPTPNITIGEVITVPNPGDDLWLSALLRQGTQSQQAIRDTMPTTFKGEKGDPGGWTMGTDLGSHTAGTALNLNDVRTPGLYRQGSTSTVTAGLYNYPPVVDINGSVRGILEVISWSGSANAVIQRYTTIGTGYGNAGAQRPRIEYTRAFGNDGWSEWDVRVSHRVDNTAGRAVYIWDPTANREQLIYGDTGARNIVGDLIGVRQAEATNAYPTIRRVGNTVTLNLNGAVVTSTSTTGQLELYVVPDGFKGSFQQVNMYVITSINPLTAKSLQLVSQKYVRLYNTPTEGDQLRYTITWETSDPWPTTLPGIPAT